MHSGELFYLLHLTWADQPAVVQLFLLGLFALVLVSAVRFVKSARLLYWYSGVRYSPENIFKGEADPDLLAASALAGRVPNKTFLKSRASSEPSPVRGGEEQAVYVLRLAESRFLYLWEGCYADVKSARRASLLAFMLSLVMGVYAAPSIYFRCSNDSNVLGSTCLLLTVWYALVLLALGWSCCTVLYFASSFFERKLAYRRTCWKYFCSRLRNELSHE
jgi:hypothetical protein